MSGQTNYITKIPWEETITTWYVHVDDGYQRICLELSRSLCQRGPGPLLSDDEIAIALIIETYFQGHKKSTMLLCANTSTTCFPI